MNRLLLLAAASLVYGCTGLWPAGWTLNETFPVSEEVRDLYTADAANQERLRRASELSALPESWRQYIRERLWEPDQ
jgi:hypothetical protein